MRYERRRRSAPRFPPKPIEMGEEYDVEIQETSSRGEGIARLKGLVTFVPDTKPGDKVRIMITRVSRRFAEGEVVGEMPSLPVCSVCGHRNQYRAKFCSQCGSSMNDSTRVYGIRR